MAINSEYTLKISKPVAASQDVYDKILETRKKAETLLEKTRILFKDFPHPFDLARFWNLHNTYLFAIREAALNDNLFELEGLLGTVQTFDTYVRAEHAKLNKGFFSH
ncbi:MAG TPA: hypothetical protein VN944_09715 [Nitrospiria bacterium]|nr:hypothetical protein [Nitrospiria bacterium]